MRRGYQTKNQIKKISSEFVHAFITDQIVHFLKEKWFEYSSDMLPQMDGVNGNWEGHGIKREQKFAAFDILDKFETDWNYEDVDYVLTTNTNVTINDEQLKDIIQNYFAYNWDEFKSSDAIHLAIQEFSDNLMNAQKDDDIYFGVCLESDDDDDS